MAEIGETVGKQSLPFVRCVGDSWPLTQVCWGWEANEQRSIGRGGGGRTWAEVLKQSLPFVRCVGDSWPLTQVCVGDKWR